ncbi:hypothetical protein BDV95DRAFT_116263 [Massariosphaeria phaeospora]|uniref:Uncharacterized protein n=1 Tax=Massariosphaeria phaeospora TaxID=100035 RepID=A0A7C8I1S7_9PLEO|nr:hypothetical protein BDV95DRAFT_116263 [Massariosphaeria phaeospora]
MFKGEFYQAHSPTENPPKQSKIAARRAKSLGFVCEIHANPRRLFPPCGCCSAMCGVAPPAIEPREASSPSPSLRHRPVVVYPFVVIAALDSLRQQIAI